MNKAIIGCVVLIAVFRLTYNSLDIKAVLWDVIGRTGNSAKNIEHARKAGKVQMPLDKSIPFPCNVSLGRSSERPTNVRMIKPGDIDVVGSIGDSLTSANGALATELQQVFIENRGVSLSNGGQGTWRTHLTIANIIKEFNPNLVGYSWGDSTTYERGSQFNVAEPTSTSDDMLFMAKELVRRIRNDRRVDFKNHWKLISILFGSNDFCLDMCLHADAYSTVEMHRQKLTEVLIYFKNNLPRTIVNIIVTPHLSVMVNTRPLQTICQYARYIECPCLFAEIYRNKRQTYFDVMWKFQQIQQQIGYDAQFKDTNDFAIVAQPHVRNVTMPRTRNPDNNETTADFSFFSADCFHLSQITHAKSANGLWNNLLQPIGKKTEDFFPLYETILCPSEDNPFIHVQ